MSRRSSNKNRKTEYSKSADAQVVRRVLLSRHVLFSVLIMLLVLGVISISFAIFSDNYIASAPEGSLLFDVKSAVTSKNLAVTGAEADLASTGDGSTVYVCVSGDYLAEKSATKLQANVKKNENNDAQWTGWKDLTGTNLFYNGMRIYSISNLEDTSWGGCSWFQLRLADDSGNQKDYWSVCGNGTDWISSTEYNGYLFNFETKSSVATYAQATHANGFTLGDYYIHNNVTGAWYGNNVDAPKMTKSGNTYFRDFYLKKNEVDTTNFFIFKFWNSSDSLQIGPDYEADHRCTLSTSNSWSSTVQDITAYGDKDTAWQVNTSGWAENKWYKLRVTLDPQTLENSRNGRVKFESTQLTDMAPTFSTTTFEIDESVDLSALVGVTASSNLGTVSYSEYQYYDGTSWHTIDDPAAWTPTSTGITKLRVKATDAGAITTAGTTKNAVSTRAETKETSITVQDTKPRIASFTADSTSLMYGQSTTLHSTTEHSTKAVVYSSSNTGVATVTGTGATATLNTVGPGDTTITATLTDSGVTSTKTLSIHVGAYYVASNGFTKSAHYSYNDPYAIMKWKSGNLYELTIDSKTNSNHNDLSAQTYQFKITDGSEWVQGHYWPGIGENNDSVAVPHDHDTVTITFDSGSKTITKSVNHPTYTVTYNCYGGTITNSSQYSSFTCESAFTLPDAPAVSKTNNDFMGWYDNDEFTGSRVTSIPAGTTENKTFYAKWRPQDSVIESFTVNTNTLEVNGTATLTAKYRYPQSGNDLTFTDSTGTFNIVHSNRTSSTDNLGTYYTRTATLTALKPGSAITITAALNGADSKTLNVTVNTPTISSTAAISMYIDQTTGQSGAVTAKSSTGGSLTFASGYPQITYSSSNTDIFTVASNGDITPKRTGTANLNISVQYNSSYTKSDFVRSVTVNARNIYVCGLKKEYNWDRDDDNKMVYNNDTHLYELDRQLYANDTTYGMTYEGADSRNPDDTGFKICIVDNGTEAWYGYNKDGYSYTLTFNDSFNHVVLSQNDYLNVCLETRNAHTDAEKPTYKFTFAYTAQSQTETMPSYDAKEVRVFYPMLVSYKNNYSASDASDYLVKGVVYGNAASTNKPADPTREGYDFAGWYSDQACTNVFDFTSAIKADTAVYAKWTIKKHNVTVTPVFRNSGKVQYAADTSLDPHNTLTYDSTTETLTSENSYTAKIEYNKSVTLNKDNNFSGYTFNGFYTGMTDGDSVTTFSIPDADVHYYACFTKNLGVTFSYNAIPSGQVYNSSILDLTASESSATGGSGNYSFSYSVKIGDNDWVTINNPSAYKPTLATESGTTYEFKVVVKDTSNNTTAESTGTVTVKKSIVNYSINSSVMDDSVDVAGTLSYTMIDDTVSPPSTHENVQAAYGGTTLKLSVTRPGEDYYINDIVVKMGADENSATEIYRLHDDYVNGDLTGANAITLTGNVTGNIYTSYSIRQNPKVYVNQPRYGSIYVTSGTGSETKYYFNGDYVKYNTQLKIHVIPNRKERPYDKEANSYIYTVGDVSANGTSIGAPDSVVESDEYAKLHYITADTTYTASIGYAFSDRNLTAVNENMRRIFFTDNNEWGGNDRNSLYVHYVFNSKTNDNYVISTDGENQSANVKMTALYQDHEFNRQQRWIYYADIPVSATHVSFNNGVITPNDSENPTYYTASVYSAYKPISNSANAYSSEYGNNDGLPRPMTESLWQCAYEDYRTVGSILEEASHPQNVDHQQASTSKNKAAVFSYSYDFGEKSLQAGNAVEAQTIVGDPVTCRFDHGTLSITPTANIKGFSLVKVTSLSSGNVKYYLIKVNEFSVDSFDVLQRLYNTDNLTAKFNIVFKSVAKGVNLAFAYSHSPHNNDDFTALSETSTISDVVGETGKKLSKLLVAYQDYKFRGVEYFKADVHDGEGYSDSRIYKSVFDLEGNTGNDIIYFNFNTAFQNNYTLTAQFGIGSGYEWVAMQQVDDSEIYRAAVPEGATTVRFYLMYSDKYSVDNEPSAEYYYAASARWNGFEDNQMFEMSQIDSNRVILGDFTQFYQ